MADGREDAAQTVRAGHFDLVAIAASLGGVEALRSIIPHLAADLPAAAALVLHRGTERTSMLRQVLSRFGPIRVLDAQEGAPIEPGTLTVAPTHLHLSVCVNRTWTLSDGRLIQYVHSAADPLFESAAAVFGQRLLAVVLTGTGRDGAEGAAAVKRGGGCLVVQDQATSRSFGMPGATIAGTSVDYVLPLQAIGPAIAALVTQGVYHRAAGGPTAQT